jgi:hypothetical protein
MGGARRDGGRSLLKQTQQTKKSGIDAAGEVVVDKEGGIGGRR